MIIGIASLITSLELVIGQVGPGWAGSTVGRAKTGSSQHWPYFFVPKF